MKFSYGYNLLLRPTEVPEGFEKMSIIRFLRCINRQEEMREKVFVTALDLLLLSSENLRETTKYLMKALREGNRLFKKRNMVIVFAPQNELYEGNELYCKREDKMASVSSIFASRLQIKDVSLYYADFEF